LKIKKKVDTPPLYILSGESMKVRKDIYYLFTFRAEQSPKGVIYK
jgi:hypothetical protein